MVARDPDTLGRFVRAALRGIEYARQNPDEAVDIVMRYAGEEADPAHQKFMLQTELADLDSAATAEHGLGWQTVAQWQALQNMLVQYGAIAAPVEIEQVFTNQFLPGKQTE